MSLHDYPHASSYLDRHKKERWRFRRAGKTISLPGKPGDPEFEAAYQAIIEGRPVQKATVKRLPTAAVPRSLRAAWRIVTTQTPEWKAMEPETQARQKKIAEAFLSSPVAEGQKVTWGEIPLDQLERRHVRMILAERSETPHAARHLLTILRKMIIVGLDEEWIRNDPTYRLKYRPAYKGWRAWTDEERAAFEKRWPIGTTPRLAYALALWLGNRRGDVAALRPDQRFTGTRIGPDGREDRYDEFRFQQGKTGRALVLPVTPMLQEVLAAADLSGPTILMTAYGKPFSAKSLTGRMRDWTHSAGLPQGCTLHGLRKTLGKMLAESGATTRQIMDSLGHTDIAHAELYSREAEQERLARDAMASVVRFVRPQKGKG